MGGFFVVKNMNIEQKSFDLEVVAGPCSITKDNLPEIEQIADIRCADRFGGFQRGIYGTRGIGLKSKTELNLSGETMGIDFHALTNPAEGIVPPSIIINEKIVQDTGLLVATEVMMPHLQLPHYVGRIPEGKLMIWNPAVMTLGWPVMEMSKFAKDNGWLVGLKNGKWLGERIAAVENPDRTVPSSMEKAWTGLATYCQGLNGSLILIHRGVDVDEKGNFRNIPVHEAARRAKRRVPGSKLYFDPSHAFGPLLRNNIVSGTINAMRILDGNSFLYDGILIEAGTSKTDTNQHVSLSELEDLTRELSTFRRLRAPT